MDDEQQNLVAFERALGHEFQVITVDSGQQALQILREQNISVLLTGPSGTGKTAVARLIHKNSPRAERPFVALNCAALPDELFENELFGAMAGSHSTATRAHDGKVKAAEGGTLFLDEVSELSARAQAKILQLLQDGTYFPLGAARARRADVRILSATNADLEDRVASRTFRDDNHGV